MEDTIKDVIEVVASENMQDYSAGPMMWWLKTVVAGAAVAGALWAITWILARAHWRDVLAREAELSHIGLSTLSRQGSGQLPAGSLESGGQLVAGSAVMSHDAVRGLSIVLRRIFGGSIGHYEDLLLRARSEALNRLRAEAVACGGQYVRGIRFQTVRMAEKRPIVAVIAFGTAY